MRAWVAFGDAPEHRAFSSRSLETVVRILSKTEEGTFERMVERLKWVVGNGLVISHEHSGRGGTCMVVLRGWVVTAENLCWLDRTLRGHGWSENRRGRCCVVPFYRRFECISKEGAHMVVEYDIQSAAEACSALGSPPLDEGGGQVLCLVFTGAWRELIRYDPQWFSGGGGAVEPRSQSG
jgi:hypothetical protein